MTMNKIFAVVAGTFLFCAGAFAQNTSPSDASPNVMFFQSAAMGPVNITTGGVGGFFVESAANGKVITGAPYTATVSTEMTQILADGNRINNKTTASLAVSRQGRGSLIVDAIPVGQNLSHLRRHCRRVRSPRDDFSIGCRFDKEAPNASGGDVHRAHRGGLKKHHVWTGINGRRVLRESDGTE